MSCERGRLRGAYTEPLPYDEDGCTLQLTRRRLLLLRSLRFHIAGMLPGILLERRSRRLGRPESPIGAASEGLKAEGLKAEGRLF